MTDDIEGEVQESTGDSAPEPSSDDAAEELSSEIRRSIDTQRERGPDGKFVKGEGKAGADRGIATGSTPPSVGEPGRKGTGAVEQQGHHPPAGFSVAAKQAWDALPEPVKADIARREQEVSAGFQRYGGLAPFADEAERNGKTLQGAVQDYVAVEKELGKDGISGIEYLCRRLGWQPLNVLKAWLSRYIPQQGQAQSASELARARNAEVYGQQIDPATIASHAAQMVRSEFQRNQIDQDIVAFQANPANRFFPNVRQDMAILVQAGKAADLQTAYEAACWLNAEIRAILLQETRGGQPGAVRTAQRAQNAAKAVSGAPSNSHAGEPPKRRDLSLDDEIRASIAAQKGLS